jgi:arylsulfatase B
VIQGPIFFASRLKLLLIAPLVLGACSGGDTDLDPTEHEGSTGGRPGTGEAGASSTGGTDAEGSGGGSSTGGKRNTSSGGAPSGSGGKSSAGGSATGGGASEEEEEEDDEEEEEEEELCDEAELELVGTATAVNTANTTTTVLEVPDTVAPGDLAVVFLLATGVTPPTITQAPVGFTTTDLAAGNHRVSYGTVGTETSLTWTTSPAATTGATAFFFRGEDLDVSVGGTASASGSSFTLPTWDTAPSTSEPGLNVGYALFGIQLPVTSPPTVTAGPGDGWNPTPLTDGRQLYTWYRPYDWNTDEAPFALSGGSGTLSASATKRAAQVLVHGPGLLPAGCGRAPDDEEEGEEDPDTDLPNILLIIGDDIGVESVSLYPQFAGDTGQVPLPHLEALAEQGLVFENAWASPMCSPTRATIVSGLYGNRTGVTTAGDVLPTSTVTVFDRLAADSPANYARALFGKYHLAGNSSTDLQHVRDLGIEFYRGFLGFSLGDPYTWTAVDINGPAIPLERYATSAITDFTIEFIDEHEANRPNDPWFVVQAHSSAHQSSNYVPPAELHGVDLGELQPGQLSNTVLNYKAILQSLDTEIGRLLAEVDLEKTTVIFIGDNGTTSSVKDTGAGVRGSKTSVYEGGIRVPLVIAGAGVTRRGREEALVTSTDLYATVLSLAGVAVDHVNDSYSLAPLLKDANATSGRTHSFTELCSGTNTRRYAIRDLRYKLLVDGAQRGLYDLVDDPLESNDLFESAAHAQVRENLEAELEAIEARATAGCFH